jgi:hypothetical protein
MHDSACVADLLRGKLGSSHHIILNEALQIEHRVDMWRKSDVRTMKASWLLTLSGCVKAEVALAEDAPRACLLAWAVL